jgi:hypothetical protein
MATQRRTNSTKKTPEETTIHTESSKELKDRGQSDQPQLHYFTEEGEEHFNVPAETAEDLITEVIHVRDDPTLNPWTFRVWFLGEHDMVFRHDTS